MHTLGFPMVNHRFHNSFPNSIIIKQLLNVNSFFKNKFLKFYFPFQNFYYTTLRLSYAKLYIFIIEITFKENLSLLVKLVNIYLYYI